MITIICGTNRPNSKSAAVAKFYSSRLTLKKIDHQYLALEDLPQDVFTNKMYGGNDHEGLNKIQDEILKTTTHFVFVVPEYNGSFPGILKSFIDASDIANCWHHKKAALVGVAAGRAGNLLGMSHLSGVLNHIKINVAHLKIPISSINQVMNEAGDITTAETVNLIDQQIDILQAL